MMKNLKCIVVTGCFLALCLAGTGIANAAPSDVEKQLQMMRQQMEMMQKKMMEMEKELQNTKQNAAQSQQTSQEVQQQISEVAGKFKVLDDLQAKFGHIKLNGYVRSRWWTGDNSDNSFDVTEIALQLRYDVSENISGEFHLWYHPSGNGAGTEYANWAGPTTFFESAFAEFRNLNIGPVNGKLIIGKARNLAFGIVPGGSYAGRVTSDYALFHTSINISRITGIQYLTAYKNFNWNFAIFNGYGYGTGRYGARNAGIFQLGVGQKNTDDNSSKAYSTRLFYTFNRNELYDSLIIGASYLTQDLSSSDLTNINTIMDRTGNYDSNDQKIAFDFALDKGPFMLKAEYAYGETAEIDAHYWYVMPGFLLSKVSKIPLDFFIRYSAANYDETRTVAGSGAWDKSQWTPLMVWTIHPRAKLFFEYYFNGEDAPSGARTARNDYGFLELILFY